MAPSAAPSAAQPAPSTGQPSTASPAGACQLTTGAGAVSISGGGGRVTTTNGVSSFSCKSAAMVTIAQIDASGVQFTVDGAPVTVPVGVATPVGPYQVTVSTVSGGKATFQVVPPG